jgi:hypothetical protein
MVLINKIMNPYDQRIMRSEDSLANLTIELWGHKIRDYSGAEMSILVRQLTVKALLDPSILHTDMITWLHSHDLYRHLDFDIPFMCDDVVHEILDLNTNLYFVSWLYYDHEDV